MSEALRTSAQDQTRAAGPPPELGGTGFGWRRLQITAAVVSVVSFIIPMILDGKVEGFLAAMAAPFVVGLLLSHWLPRTGAIFLGIVSLGILLASAPFLGESLVHPEALGDFVSTALLTLSCIVGAAAAVPAYRAARTGDTGSRSARTVGFVAAALAALATGFSIVTAAGVQDVQAQPGDIAVLTEDFVFAPVQFHAEAGTVAIHLTNNDSTRHTFTIDGVTDVSVPPNSSQRATFEAAPGTYRFYCVPHAPEMDGQLVVK